MKIRRYGLMLALTACQVAAAPAMTPAEEIISRFIDAADGSVIELPAGRFEFKDTLTVSANNLTIRGAGMDRTILSFTAQTKGNGIDATGKKLAFENFAIVNSKADGLKVQNCEDLVVRGVSVSWDGPPKETNGGYAIYPVGCKRVLMERNYVRGASDSGLYVGQSQDVVIRHNRATENVAGIEIENTLRADVHDNEVWGNTGGVLVFSLPDLPIQKNGAGTRVFRNRIHDNNTANFAPKGNIVGMVPAGTGLMILANREVEVFDNTVANHQTASVIVTSYYASERPLTDASYEALAYRIHIHDNTLSNAGYAPSGMAADIRSGMSLAGVRPERMPHVLHDGILAGKVKSLGELEVCLTGNRFSEPSQAFANLALEDAGFWKALFRIWKPRVHEQVPPEHACRLPALPAVALP